MAAPLRADDVGTEAAQQRTPPSAGEIRCLEHRLADDGRVHLNMRHLCKAGGEYDRNKAQARFKPTRRRLADRRLFTPELLQPLRNVLINDAVFKGVETNARILEAVLQTGASC